MLIIMEDENDDEDGRKLTMALDDLFVELELDASNSIAEIFQRILGTLLSLQREIWQDCFLKIMDGSLPERFFAGNFSKERQLKDLEAQFFRPDLARCSSFQDVFEKFARKKLVPTPECYKENT
eukprot:TCONS_00037669-protein